MANIKDIALGVVVGLADAFDAVGRIIKRHWITAIAAVGVIVLLTGGAVAVLLWPMFANTPDPAAQSPREIKQYLASGEFGEKTVEQRRQYLQKALESQNDDRTDRDGGDAPDSPRRRGMWRLLRGGEELTDVQRKQMFENLKPLFQQRAEEHRKQMHQRLDDYFASSPQEKQQKLDQLIDRMQRWRGRRRDGDARGRGRGQGASTKRMKRMIEGSPPEFRAKMTEFIKDLHKRMDERGIQPPA